MALGRSTDPAGSKSIGRLRSQSKARKFKCYHCHKEGHYRKDCPDHKVNKKDNSKIADVAGVVESNSDGADVLSKQELIDSRKDHGVREKVELELEQLDVNTTILHGELEEQIFMHQPEGFVIQDREDPVCLLKKILIWTKAISKAMGTIVIEKISAVENPVDMMTKHIPEIKFEALLRTDQYHRYLRFSPRGHVW
ncbi:hypothetical protein RJ639_024274 [Escallonia herrerae]|uniref:CCHC-type domain-containing protein n=1 Tax=Escallonia herrerae TaxID=1293975 RepID=A0AA89AF81_9ASTE|nr:hypothetical protein RJ639_024274 [Escallonia herrerae]